MRSLQVVSLWLALVVFGAFGIETAMGFGCNVLAVTVGIYLLPLETLLVALVSLNLLVSSWIVLRHHDTVDLRLLLTRILPAMLLGMPVGMLLFNLAEGTWLKGGFGLFVSLLGALELTRVWRSDGSPAAPLAPWRAVATLAFGGVMHGLYASGGPMAVYYASRQIPDKGSFRGTLSLLWLLLNLVLLVSYGVRGLITSQTMLLALPEILPLAGGLIAGELLHARIDERAFRMLIFALLVLGGLVLLASM